MAATDPVHRDAHDLAAQFIASATWERLPTAVQEKARFCLVDNLGAALAGTLTRISQISAGYARHTWPGKAATILGGGKSGLGGLPAAPLGAAFANGCAANGIDVDDSARYAYGHAGVQIFATALAVAEGCGASGAQLLAGMVVGYEVAHRVGRAWHASRPVYQACGSWGSVACAAVAAHLMGLPADQAGQALNIAEVYAPNLPMMRDVDHPGMVKHGIEWAALTGIISAELAGRGFTGAPGLLSRPEYQAWGQTIGTEYLIVDGVAWKAERYACCGWAHAGVEGARQLVLEHAIALNDIARILVEGGHGTFRLGTRLPETTEQAQFNQAWPLAAMLVDGEIGPAQMLEPRLKDAQIRALAQKVDVVESEEMEYLCRLFEQGDPRGRFASRVTITLRDGRQFHSGLVDGGLRFPPQGWDRERMGDKFRWLAGFVLPPSQAGELLETLWRLDELAEVRNLTGWLAAAARPPLPVEELEPTGDQPPPLQPDGNARVAEFIHQLDWNDLPAHVQQRARLCLLEVVGTALASTHSPAGTIAAGLAASLWGGDEAAIWLHSARARAAGAAFANACAAETPENGTAGLGTAQQPERTTLLATAVLAAPAALAVGESVGASGQALLEALVIGCEVGLRARRCWQVEQPFEQASGAWGSLSSAAAAARLYGLDPVQIQQALGIADYHAPNAPRPQEPQAPQTPAMTAQAAGWGTMNGVTAAELAQRGFTGIPSLLGTTPYQAWVMDLGQHYWMVDGAPDEQTASPADAADRFRRRAGQVLAPKKIEALIALVLRFETLENVRQFTCLLA